MKTEGLMKKFLSEQLAFIGKGLNRTCLQTRRLPNH